MTIYIENLVSKGKKIISILIISGFIAEGLVLGIIIPKRGKAEFVSSVPMLTSPTIQENSLLAVSNPSLPPYSVQKLEMVITAYSSTVSQTDSNPFITASGSKVRDGIVANNFLSFGTKIRIPDVYGDKIFVVEDRMHWRKSNYHLDIWFPEYWQAKNFGRKSAYIEILEN